MTDSAEYSGNEQPMRVLRVCMLIESYCPVVGGMESQARTLASGLSERGVSLHILTRRVTADMPASDVIDGVPVTRIGPVGNRAGGRWLMALKVLPWLLKHRRDYDLILVPGFRTLGVSAVVARKLTGRPCVLKADSRGELSGSFFAAGLAKRGIAPQGLAARSFMAIWRKMLGGADAFVSMSAEMTEEFIENGVAPDHIHQISNTVDTSIFKPVGSQEKSKIREELGIAPEKTVFIYTGRLVSYKGLPGLLEAWYCNQASGAGGCLLIVGSGGHDQHNCESALRAFVSRHGLEASVRFVGETDRVHRYLQASDIFVFPTEEEAFGLSLIEAMACGLAVISTRVGGIAEFLRDGVNGVAMEAGAADALAAAMRALQDDGPRCQRLGEEGVKTVMAAYAPDRICRAYADLFSTVLRVKNSPWDQES